LMPHQIPCQRICCATHAVTNLYNVPPRGMTQAGRRAEAQNMYPQQAYPVPAAATGPIPDIQQHLSGTPGLRPDTRQHRNHPAPTLWVRSQPSPPAVPPPPPTPPPTPPARPHTLTPPPPPPPVLVWVAAAVEHRPAPAAMGGGQQRPQPRLGCIRQQLAAVVLAPAVEQQRGGSQDEDRAWGRGAWGDAAAVG
jgi:hypothetical protein